MISLYSWKYWINFSTRIGRAEFIFKFLVLDCYIIIVNSCAKLFSVEVQKVVLLCVGVTLWPIIISMIKQRLNDLKPHWSNFIWFLIKKGDSLHNEYGSPPIFSSKWNYVVLAMFFTLSYLANTIS